MADNNTPEAFPEPSDKAIQDARKQGVVDAITESTKDAYKAGANEGYGGDGKADRFADKGNAAHLEALLDLSLDDFKALLDGKPQPDTLRPVALSEGQIAGLLERERSGKNRTDFVKMLCKRLGIKSPYEATSAGPAWTNDTTNVTAL